MLGFIKKLFGSKEAVAPEVPYKVDAPAVEAAPVVEVAPAPVEQAGAPEPVKKPAAKKPAAQKKGAAPRTTPPKSTGKRRPKTKPAA